MKAYGGVDAQIHIFLISSVAGVGGEWSALLTCFFTPWEMAPRTHWIGGWVGPSQSGRVENSNPSVFQPVANRYTACAIPAPRLLTLLESTDTPIEISNIFQFQNINSSFHIFSVFPIFILKTNHTNSSKETVDYTLHNHLEYFRMK
jgi:hypothetical protein